MFNQKFQVYITNHLTFPLAVGAVQCHLYFCPRCLIVSFWSVAACPSFSSHYGYHLFFFFIFLKLCLETDYMCCLRQFLYPSEDDLYKLIRFLVERLSEISEDRRTADVKDVKGRGRIKDDDKKSTSEDQQQKDNNGGVDLSCKKVGAKLEDLRLNIEVSDRLNTKVGHASLSRLHEADLIPRKMDEVAVDDVYFSRTGDFSKDKLTTLLSGKECSEEVVDAGRDTAGNEETAAWRDDKHVLVFEQKGSPFREQSSKVFSFELL